MTTVKPWTRTALMCGLMFCALPPAHSAVLDFLLGKSAGATETEPLDPKQRSWRLGDFNTVQLAPREADATDNQHPSKWSAEVLRQQLGAIRAELRGGTEPLFGADEVAALAVPLSQALALAKPADDVLVLSTSRRGGGILMAPYAITARFFVQGGELQMIVRDARLDFFDAYRGTNIPPTFIYGSRSKQGSAVLQSTAAVSRRADWLSIPVAVPAAAAGAAPNATPAAPAAIAVVPAAAAVAPVVSPAPAAATTKPAAAPTPLAAPSAAPRPRDPGFADEIEQRLTTLKRLLDKKLISEDEYQQKRKEVLKLL